MSEGEAREGNIDPFTARERHISDAWDNIDGVPEHDDKVENITLQVGRGLTEVSGYNPDTGRREAETFERGRVLLLTLEFEGARDPVSFRVTQEVAEFLAQDFTGGEDND